MYVKSDKTKGKARERYLVISEEGDWLSIRKFTSNQLRAFAYYVKRSDVYCVPYPPDKQLRPKQTMNVMKQMIFHKIWMKLTMKICGKYHLVTS